MLFQVFKTDGYFFAAGKGDIDQDIQPRISSGTGKLYLVDIIGIKAGRICADCFQPDFIFAPASAELLRITFQKFFSGPLKSLFS